MKRIISSTLGDHRTTVKSVKEKFDKCAVAIESPCESHWNVDTKDTTQGLFVYCLLFQLSMFPLLSYDALEAVKFAQHYLQFKGFTLDKSVANIETLRLFTYDGRKSSIEACNWTSSFCATSISVVGHSSPSHKGTKVTDQICVILLIMPRRLTIHIFISCSSHCSLHHQICHLSLSWSVYSFL